MPPRSLKPEIDPRVEALCLKMLSKTAADRLPSMDAVAREVLKILREPKLAGTDSSPSTMMESTPAAILNLTDATRIEELARSLLLEYNYAEAAKVLGKILSHSLTPDQSKLLEIASVVPLNFGNLSV